MLCDRIAIMDKGKILQSGQTHKLIEGTKTPFKISFIVASLSQKIFGELAKLGVIENLAGKSNHFEMHLKTQADLSRAVDIIQKLKPESLTVGRASLEDLFVELTGKAIAKEENV